MLKAATRYITDAETTDICYQPISPFCRNRRPYPSPLHKALLQPGCSIFVFAHQATVLTVACSFAMVKVKKILKRDVNRRIAAEDKKMPFQPSPTIAQPRSMKDRQQMWILSGLTHIRAPLVPKQQC